MIALECDPSGIGALERGKQNPNDAIKRIVKTLDEGNCSLSMIALPKLPTIVLQSNWWAIRERGYE
jgi:hypothetical protein